MATGQPPSARKWLLLGSAIDTRLAPPACSTAPERPRMDVSLAQRGPSSPGRRVPCKVAILPREVSFAALETTKMAFRRLWHAIEVPHTPSSATQSRGMPIASEQREKPN